MTSNAEKKNVYNLGMNINQLNYIFISSKSLRLNLNSTGKYSPGKNTGIGCHFLLHIIL